MNIPLSFTRFERVITVAWLSTRDAIFFRVASHFILGGMWPVEATSVRERKTGLNETQKTAVVLSKSQAPRRSMPEMFD